MYIVIVGNPVDGFSYYGPFEDRETAIKYAERNFRNSGDWWVHDLMPIL